jgi:hypothetical protein
MVYSRKLPSSYLNITLYFLNYFFLSSQNNPVFSHHFIYFLIIRARGAKKGEQNMGPTPTHLRISYIILFLSTTLYSYFSIHLLPTSYSYQHFSFLFLFLPLLSLTLPNLFFLITSTLYFYLHSYYHSHSHSHSHFLFQFFHSYLLFLFLTTTPAITLTSTSYSYSYSLPLLLLSLSLPLPIPIPTLFLILLIFLSSLLPTPFLPLSLPYFPIHFYLSPTLYFYSISYSLIFLNSLLLSFILPLSPLLYQLLHFTAFPLIHSLKSSILSYLFLVSTLLLSSLV